MRVEDHGARFARRDLREQQHVIGDVVEDAEAEDDVERLDLVDLIEDVAENKRITLA